MAQRILRRLFAPGALEREERRQEEGDGDGGGVTDVLWVANPLVAGPIPVGGAMQTVRPTRACEPRHHAEPCVRGRLWPPWARSEISDRLGTDLGTKLCETASNQCNDIQPVKHPKPADVHSWDKASRPKLPVRSS